jgi:AraC-like DNA-binding protein
VDYAGIDRFLVAAVAAAGRGDIGLLIGERYRLADLGALGDLLQSCATLGDALRALGAYHRLNSDSAAAHLTIEGSEAFLAYAVFQPGTRAMAQINEMAMACCHACVRELVGQRLPLLRVQFSHAAPRDTEPHRRVFGHRIEFDADRTALVFPVAWLQRVLPTADRARRDRIERAIAGGPEGRLLPRVYRALRVELCRAPTSGDEVAQRLDMHRRTFNRRLRAEGTTFRKVLDEVRFEVARQLLEHTAAPLVRISESLGYGEASAFNRAFKRWSGRTPMQWRVVAQRCSRPREAGRSEHGTGA